MTTSTTRGSTVPARSAFPALSPADPPDPARAPDPPGPPAVDIVVPVYNEEADLEPSVRRLHAYLSEEFPFTFRITIADNASTDGTAGVAASLAAALPGVRAISLDRKGRGLALRHVWTASDAAVLAYMDVDLSTDLNALLPLVAPLVTGHSDLAIGTRLARTARVLRGPKREIVSRCYNMLLHTALSTRFTDAQCGFKAIRADVARELLPLVRDDAWFFDTELLVLAERAGLRIGEVPVDWVDDPDSRVDIVRTALDDLRGVARLGSGFATGRVSLDDVGARLGARSVRHTPGLAQQVLRFAAIGTISTLCYALLFLLLRPAMSAQAANVIALVVTAVANTSANSRYTFAIHGRRRAVRHQLQGLVVFALALALTSGSLHLIGSGGSHAIELAVLIGANLAATLLRFVLLRGWVFRNERSL